MNPAVERFNFVRAELVKLYQFIVYSTFEVKAPRSVFLTTRQLEQIESNPPIWGKDYYTRSEFRLVTCVHLMNAFEIMNGDLELGFAKAKTVIPKIYDNIQNYIRYWLEIKINASHYTTPSIEELRALENVCRGVYNVYSHFKREIAGKAYREGFGNTEFFLANMHMARIQYGSYQQTQDVSFISYIDKYLEDYNSSELYHNNYLKNNYKDFANKSDSQLMPQPLTTFPQLHIGLS